MIKIVAKFEIDNYYNRIDWYNTTYCVYNFKYYPFNLRNVIIM